MGKEVLISLLTQDCSKPDFSESFKTVREELDEHLDSINQTAEEVQYNYEYLCRLDDKLDKLGERMEQIALLLKFHGCEIPDVPSQNVELSEKEKEVFLVIYTSDNRMLSYREIADGIRESEFIVRGYITSLIQKGIPIKKKYNNNTAYVQLEPRFKDMQAKTNLLKISQKTVKEFA